MFAWYRRAFRDSATDNPEAADHANKYFSHLFIAILNALLILHWPGGEKPD
jgi:hypothetical protein